MAAELSPAALAIEPGAFPLPLSSPALFGRDCPLELEIGVGKGRFLLDWAAAHPEIGLLGVERAGVYLRLTEARAIRRGIANVRLIHTTAEDMLFRCLSAGSLAAVHVYFPDPWPKKRHHKRRFFRADNAARVAEVLAPGGLLRVKTDHEGYAAVIAEVLAGVRVLAPVPEAEAFAGIPESGFEVKYAREGRPLWRFARRREG